MLVFATAITTGCLPSNRTIQPEVTITVVDEAGQPVVGANLLFIAGTHPHHMLRKKDKVVTDEQGQAHFPRQKEWQIIAPFMIHGVSEYYWEWCVTHDGYEVAVGKLSFEERENKAVQVALQPGQPTETCVLDGGEIVMRPIEAVATD